MLLNGISRQYWHFVKPRYLRLRPSVLNETFSRFKTSYIVLLPEVPDDNSTNNPLLSNEEFPNFVEITSENCYSGMGKHCLDYETNIWSLDEKLKDGTIEKTFDSVISEVEKLDAALTYAWSTVKTFFCVRNDVLSTANYLKIHERARKARVFKYKSKSIFNACKEIYVKSDITEIQKRVLRKFMLEARLNGLELPDKEYEILLQTIQKLEETKSVYKEKLKIATGRFSYRIMDQEIVQDFPPYLLKKMAFNADDPQRGPWTVTHHPQIYESFMEHCPHKDLRENAWKAYILRSSAYLVNELNNSLHVEEIRDYRMRQANLLGFKTFADMSMETKMAGSVDNVLALLASLFDKAKERQSEELETLKQFAKSNGLEGDLEEFDVPYWRRKHLNHTTQFDDIQIEEYLPFNNVWEQLLSLCSNLFGIHFEEVSTTTSVISPSPSSDLKIKVWNPKVRFYYVLDTCGKRIASFYLDAFRRPNQKIESHLNTAWMLALKSKCDTVNYLPCASLVFNFTAPTPDGDNLALLTFEDLQTLFKKFGHALQHLLSTVPYSQVSGLTNIEWDAVEMCPNFMLHWLYEPTVLEKVAKHYKTGEILPKKIVKSLLKKRSHMAGYDLCNELFLSHLDLKLHTDEAHWVDILKELWPIYKPFQLNKNNFLPCWFSPIMTDVWPAAYYSHTWSKMIAADSFSAFKESEPQEITTVGSRFRETFLSLGGGIHSAEVFRQFRGRDPTPEALLNGLS